MPTTKKKPASKSVVGGLKSKPKWKIGFLALAALLLVSSIAYAGYGKFQIHRLNAKAYSWSILPVNIVGPNYPPPQGFALYACKTQFYSSTYGNLYTVRMQVHMAGSGSNDMIEITQFSSNGVLGNRSQQHQWLYGAVAGTELTISKDLGQRVKLYVSDSTPTHTTGYYAVLYGSTMINPGNLVNC